MSKAARNRKIRAMSHFERPLARRARKVLLDLRRRKPPSSPSGPPVALEPRERRGG